LNGTPPTPGYYARLASPAISPDGTQAVEAVTRYDLPEGKGITNLWLVPADGGPARQRYCSSAGWRC